MKKILFAVLAVLIMTGCNESSKVLVLYYSQTGTTKAVAEEIKAQIGAEICAFDVEQVYDGTFEETIQRCLKERGEGFVPDLKELKCKLSDYDVIFLGYPVWFGTFAPPVKALLASADLEGKMIVPFCTFGSGGLQSSTEDLREALPCCEVVDGFGIRTARLAAAKDELHRYLIENGWKEGEIEPLPDFSDQEPVSEEELVIFDAACSDYQFPLGEPLSFGSRLIPGGKEYRFQTAESTIFVTALDDKTPEFTQVIR